MPKSKRLAAYPREYYDLLQRAIGGESLTVQLDTKKQAESLRFDIYGFRAALREDTEMLQSPEDMELALLADTLEFLIDDNKLLIQSKDSGALMLAVRETLK